MTATLDQSRNDLDRLVHLARAGEEVFITENGQPVVQLVALAPLPQPSTVEPAPTKSNASHDEILAEIHALLRKAGHVPPTREEVDRHIAEERASWD